MYQRTGVGAIDAEERNGGLGVDGFSVASSRDGGEARRGHAGAASGDTAGEHIGGGVGGGGW